MFDAGRDDITVHQLRLAMAVKTAELETDRLSGTDAAALVEDLARLEALAHTALVLVADRAAASGAWRTAGDRSPAHWLARIAGITLGLARQMLTTATRLEDQPHTARAARDGTLGRDKLHDVADAAADAPDDEQRLVDTAEHDSVRATRDECKRTKAKRLSDTERARRAHAGRYLRRRANPDGTAGFDYQGPTRQAAEIDAAISHFQQAIFERARRDGTRDTYENHAADALHLMARTAMSRLAGDTAPGDTPTGDVPATPTTVVARPDALRPKIIIRVDHAALTRGHVDGDELCEIAGLGPIPAATVAELLADAHLAVIVTRGVDILSVAHHSRRPSAHQTTALQWAHTTCTVTGCDNTVAIEIDHRTPWAEDHTTHLPNLDPLCSHHHYLKTHRGHRLEPGTGRRHLLGPHDPDPDRPATGLPPPPARPFPCLDRAREQTVEPVSLF